MAPVHGSSHPETYGVGALGRFAKAINFCARFLHEGPDGKLHLPLTTRSPEYANAADCAYGLSLIRWGARTLIDSARRLAPRGQELRPGVPALRGPVDAGHGGAEPGRRGQGVPVGLRSAGAIRWIRIRSEAGEPLTLDHGIAGAVEVRTEHGHALPRRESGAGRISVQLPRGATAVVTPRGERAAHGPREVPSNGSARPWGLPR
ncbi:hypothetical protein [Streptomyces beijiangensis]|uniref:Uncharacterized protein n=1 Tax=Streptomyces beijiangensis TaxID=163361 RepID=A0A939JG49_9ACTN|nr:hypothetical protein [Streptomyces beijiangensis]MBO0514816.1 hypothetical protein [Streptomyces beijiangensis]